MHGTGFWRRHMEEKSAQQLAVQPLEWDVFTWMFQAHLREQCMRSFLSSSAQTLILVRLTQQEAVDLSKNANILTNKTLPGAFFFSLWHHRVLCTNVIADIKSNASAYAKSGYSSCHFKLICQLYDARIHVALSLKNLQHSCCLKLKHSFRGSVFHLESIWTSGEPTWRSTLLSEKDPVCALAGGLIASSVEWQLLKGFF